MQRPNKQTWKKYNGKIHCILTDCSSNLPICLRVAMENCELQLNHHWSFDKLYYFDINRLFSTIIQNHCKNSEKFRNLNFAAVTVPIQRDHIVSIAVETKITSLIRCNWCIDLTLDSIWSILFHASHSITIHSNWC